MNRQIDEVDPCGQNVERRPELRARGLGNHSRNFRRGQRPNGVVKVIHKRLRSTNLPVEEDVGEDSKGHVNQECREEETEERPHYSLDREQCSVRLQLNRKRAGAFGSRS